MLNIQFNHSKDKIEEVFCLDESSSHRIEMAIMFEGFVGLLQTDELEQNGETVDYGPNRIYSTKSGCLERCMQHMHSDAEAAFLMFKFVHYHSQILDRYMNYARLPQHLTRLIDEINEDDSLDEFEKEAKINLAKIFVKKEAKAGKVKETEKVINAIKSANYDFHKFLYLYDEQYDVDNMLDEILRKKEQN
jgi:uncharacterized protein YdiU (UPF0061 family)